MLGAALDENYAWCGASKKNAGSCVRQNLNLFAFEQTRSP